MTKMLPRQIISSTMLPYQSTNPLRSQFTYNQASIEYNSHVTYNYSEVAGLMMAREVARTIMRGRTDGSL